MLLNTWHVVLNVYTLIHFGFLKRKSGDFDNQHFDGVPNDNL